MGKITRIRQDCFFLRPDDSSESELRGFRDEVLHSGLPLACGDRMGYRVYVKEKQKKLYGVRVIRYSTTARSSRCVVKFISGLCHGLREADHTSSIPEDLQRVLNCQAFWPLLFEWALADATARGEVCPKVLLLISLFLRCKGAFGFETAVYRVFKMMVEHRFWAVYAEDIQIQGGFTYDLVKVIIKEFVRRFPSEASSVLLCVKNLIAGAGHSAEEDKDFLFQLLMLSTRASGKFAGVWITCHGLSSLAT